MGYKFAFKNSSETYKNNTSFEDIYSLYIFDKMLKLIRINLPEEDHGKYAHRNYLGGIVKLGLKREKVGEQAIPPYL